MRWLPQNSCLWTTTVVFHVGRDVMSRLKTLFALEQEPGNCLNWRGGLKTADNIVCHKISVNIVPQSIMTNRHCDCIWNWQSLCTLPISQIRAFCLSRQNWSNLQSIRVSFYPSISLSIWLSVLSLHVVTLDYGDQVTRKPQMRPNRPTRPVCFASSPCPTLATCTASKVQWSWSQPTSTQRKPSRLCSVATSCTSSPSKTE